jgi:surface antigen
MTKLPAASRHSEYLGGASTILTSAAALKGREPIQTIDRRRSLTMQPISHLAHLGSARAAQLVAAVALAGAMLPVSAGTSLAATPYAAMSQRSITIPATATDMYDAFSGTVTLAQGGYIWTSGLFSPAAASLTTYYGRALPIMGKLVPVWGGTYNWTCTVYGYSATNSYTETCIMKNAQYPDYESYSMAITGFSSVNYNLGLTYNWQESWVLTHRALGKTTDKNYFPKNNAAGRAECTWGAQNKFHSHFGIYINVTGNALNWYTAARNNGWTVTTEPQTDSIVVWQPGVDKAGSGTGHVGWVEGVEYRNGVPYIHTAETNVGPVGSGTKYYNRILRADVLANAGRGYILGTNFNI